MKHLTYLSLFLSSFLLFSLEFMAGKYFLINFGGSSSVWVTLMVFFSTFLLFGYMSVLLIRPKHYANVLLLILLVVIFQFVKTKSLFNFNFNFFDPRLSILFSVIASIGIYVLTLSSISSFLPFLSNSSNPYNYYSISNLGSLIGLLAYPFVIEPFLPFDLQQIFWSLVLVANLIIVLIVVKVRHSNTSEQKVDSGFFPLVVIFSAISTGYLLTTTNAINSSIGSYPLFWSLPLIVYLLSFIISFTPIKIIQYEFHLPLVSFFLFVSVALQTHKLFLGNLFHIIWLLVTQFIVNIIFHKYIYETRPPRNKLPYYYLSLALGGAIGTIVLSLVAPTLLSRYSENNILIYICILSFIYISVHSFNNKKITLQFTTLSLLLAFGISFINKDSIVPQKDFSVKQNETRNFYGPLNLIEVFLNGTLVERQLLSGSTNHGTQSFGGMSETTPTMYYSRRTALGSLFSLPLKNVGVIGLGAGTIAAYCNSGMKFTFYEINPSVIEIAKNKFTYLKNCVSSGGKVEIIEGDARISLQRTDSHKYDLLIIDAFTDDSVPTHLLTKEALNLYLEHLTDNGVIAFHVSNRYLDLKPTLVVTAESLNLHSSSHISPDANYVLLSKNIISIGRPESKSLYLDTEVWTDNYSSIIQALKL